MALAVRTVVTQLARDALARWASRATGLTIHAGDSNEPRPARPYVSLTFPRGRSLTGSRSLVDLTETLGAHAVTVTAAAGAPTTLLVNGARVSVRRGLAADLPTHALAIAAGVSWWTRGRATATAAGAVVTIAPDAPGLLLECRAVEGATVVLGPAGPARKLGQRLLRATCRVDIMGAAPGAAVGVAGDGLDTYAIEEALREGLSDPATKQELRGAFLVPHGLPAGEPGYASTVSGALRESRVSFDLTFGWTAWWTAPSEALLEVAFEDLAAGEGAPGLVMAPVGWPESGVPAIELALSLP